MAVSYPPIFINTYLQQKLGQAGFGAMPMFPTVPTDPDAFADGFTLDQLTGDDPAVRFAFGGQIAIYDRMFKMRRGPFPHIRSEQLLYYFNAVREDAVPNLLLMTQAVSDLLDRGDESAEDINRWVGDNMLNQDGIYIASDGLQYLPVYFHDFKIYQLEETRDIIDFGTARTYAGNKIIIDYTYHTKGYPKPETGLGNTSYNDTAI
jgi:hypothetical protein